jgi:predicted GNAT superfamily acetyltransferase
MSGVTERPNIIIRDIESISEMRAVELLEKEVWGCEDLDIVPLTLLAAARESGGILIGAFDESLLVGFAFGFVGQEKGEVVHHSHMLGVKPSHRSFNLGYKLKLAQRDRALQLAITLMTWTFDPLQSLNAYFNFGKLGVLSDNYKINFYGETTSSPLHQTGTDRLWVTWFLDSPRVKARIEQNSPIEFPDLSDTTLIRCSEANAPLRVATVYDIGDVAGIEIPEDINSIERSEPNLARKWREETRRAFSDAIEAGFIVRDFVRKARDGQTVGVYILSRGNMKDF